MTELPPHAKMIDSANPDELFAPDAIGGEGLDNTPESKPDVLFAPNVIGGDFSPATNTPIKPLDATTLSYSLGADDISKVVDALLPVLSPSFPENLTKEEQYVALHKGVLNLSKNKTFTNKDDLDTLVKEQIVKPIVKTVLNNTIQTANPDGSYFDECWVQSPPPGCGQ